MKEEPLLLLSDLQKLINQVVLIDYTIIILGGYYMHNENYSIIFSSMTGNTRKLADKIHEILPKESCDYFGTADARGI